MFIEETISSGVYTSKLKLIPIQFHTVCNIGNKPFGGIFLKYDGQNPTGNINETVSIFFPIAPQPQNYGTMV